MKHVHTTTRTTHILVALALALAAFATTNACGPAAHEAEGDHAHEHEGEVRADTVTLTPEAIASNGIRVEQAARHELRPTFRVPARIAFNVEGMAHVGSPVKGRISEWRVRLGDEVEKGAVLMVLESPEVGEAQNDFLVKRRAALASVPHETLARDAFERARALHEETQGIALSEVHKRELELVSAQSAQSAARAAEGAASNRLLLLGMTPEAVANLTETETVDPHVSVRAPIGGQVIEREATLGELVGPERNALLVLADVSRLSVSADVPESRLRDTVVGARARVLLGLEQEHWCEGRIEFISPALDAATRSVRVRIDVSDHHPELRPGVFARAEIEVPEVEGASDKSVLAVPEGAVHSIAGQSAVFVPLAAKPGTFAMRVVRAGTLVHGMIPILAGLAEGEDYVASGGFVLKAALSNTQVSHAH